MRPMANGGEDRPTLALTMGDPLGIGPEVLIKALSDPSRRERARYVIYGMGGAMALAADRAGIDPFWWRAPRGSDAARSDEARDRPVLLHDYDPTDRGDSWALSGPAPGRATKSGGHASFMFVEDAIADALDGLAGGGPGVEGIVTAPISKLAWSLAGRGKYPGHTELFATRFGAKRTRMLFHCPRMRVALVTAHVPLMDIRNVLTIGRVFDTIDLAHEALIEEGTKRARIAVCGLNPHAGEGGILGREERDNLDPIFDGLRARFPGLSRCQPADTVFHRALQGEYDGVVALYHDQGLAPLKTLEFDEAVNITLGLPHVRTSPDHGTAYALAGKGEARANSFANAVRLARRLAAPDAAARK